MSATFMQSLVRGNLPTLAAIVNNGECRLMAVTDSGATDDQGFPAPSRSARISDFLPCSWTLKSKTDAGAGETITGAQPRGLLEYEITIAKSIDAEDVSVQVDDLMELREAVGGDSVTLLITSVVNQTNGAWYIKAMNTNAE